MFNALEKSHRNEKRLNTKCQELGSEIASKQAQVDAACDKTLEDQDTISSLKKEIEKAWKMVDMTQEREERARETIETLNTEIQNLTKVIEEKTLGAEDTNLNELRKLRDELTNQVNGDLDWQYCFSILSLQSSWAFPWWRSCGALGLLDLKSMCWGCFQGI